MPLLTQTANSILASADLNTNWADIEDAIYGLGPVILSGLVPSAGTGLSVNVTAGTAVVLTYNTISAFTIGSLTPSTTNHLYWIEATGGTSNTTGTAPVDSVKLGTATTGASTVTSVDTSIGSGRQVKTALSGVIRSTISTKTGAYTLTATDSVILADATGAAFTVTLPTAVGISGTVYFVKRINAGGNNVTLDGAGAEVIDGATTYVLTAQWQSVTIISDGAAWFVL